MHGYISCVEVDNDAKAAIEKAMDIDETLPETIAWSAIYSQWFEWDWSAAEKKYKQAIEMNLNIIEELFQYAWYLRCMRRNEEAFIIEKSALKIDPISSYAIMWRGYHHFLAGQYDEAITYIKESLEIDPIILLLNWN